MESKVINTSDRILTIVKQKGTITFTELEGSLDDSYNLIFLAIDKLVREDKISLKRDRTEYLLSTRNHRLDLNGLIKNHVI
ncbi:MAG: hypothetical protein PH343_05560 [Nitrospira sp.]|nr:hypothetical protein [Nitrospira sp.]